VKTHGAIEKIAFSYFLRDHLLAKGKQLLFYSLFSNEAETHIFKANVRKG
jgi:hypothetical protein